MKTRSNRLNNGYVGGNFLDTSQYGVLPVNKQATSNEWTRPIDWLPLPSMVEGDSKIAGLVAVYPGDTGSTGITASSNFVAFTVFGNYTVDWGDGTSQSYSSGVTASKQYLWEGASADTLTSDGFRQRVFQITPQAGAGLTRANFEALYPGVSLWVGGSVDLPYYSAILDLKISGASLASIKSPRNIFQFEYVGDSNITTQYPSSTNATFSNCKNLRRIVGTSWTKKCTNFSGMFSGCSSLQTVPLFNTALGTNFSSMFSGCSSLQTVPLFNTALGTSFFGMFIGCDSLRRVPLFNTALGTNFSSMFSICGSLQTVPLFNTALGTNFSSMFNGCVSLQTVPLFNTALCTGTSSFSSMFNGCSSLQTVPLFNTALGTNFSSMFSGCGSLQTVPLFNTALGTNFSGMFSICSSLQAVPLLNVSNSTLFTDTFKQCPNLKSAALGQPFRDLNYTNCALSAAELNRIFTNLQMVGPPSGSPPGYQAHITITGNWGANQCDITIAYGKNWEVLS